MPRKRREITAFVAGVTALALGTACVHADPPSVGVKALESDVVFGVKPPPTNVAPANTGALDNAALNANIEQLAAPLRPLTKTKPVLPCPPARLNAFAEPTIASVPYDPPVLARPGAYRWKRSGTIQANGIKAVLSGFDQRTIQNVKQIRVVPNETAVDAPQLGHLVVLPAGVEYTYDVVQPDIANPGVTLITSYRMRGNGFSAQTDLPVDPLGAQSGRVNVGEPDRGLVLERIQNVSGEKTGSFQPLTGLLLLPMPVRAGESFASVAIDPSTLQTLALTAKVIGPETIDACGTVIQGWRVAGSLVSSADNVPTTYSYIIEPQDGGVIISETIKRAVPVAVDVTFTLGQKDPTPVAEAGK